MKLKIGFIIVWLILGGWLTLIGSLPGILWFIVFAVIFWGVPSKSSNASREGAPDNVNYESSSAPPVVLRVPPKLPTASSNVLDQDTRSQRSVANNTH
jgi:hypothetical protein